MAAFLGHSINLLKNKYRHLFRSCCVASKLQRSYGLPTSPYKYLNITPDTTPGVTILEMNRPPVNSLSLEFLTELIIALEKLENDKGIRGVILTSSIPGIFSAGLDIYEFTMKLERMREFWKTFQEFWIRLYGCRLVVVSAISGHALAAGAAVAMSTDYRVMSSGKYTIGMTEAMLGILPPFWLLDVFYNTVGFHKSEIIMQLAKRYKAEEAYTLGMVDEVTSPAQLMDVTRHHMNDYLLVPDVARQLLKTQMRKSTILKLQTHREEDMQTFIDIVTKDYIQKLISSYLEGLKKKT